MLMLINKINVLHTWSVSQGKFFTLMSNLKHYIRSIPKKKLQKKINLSCTGLIFLTFFQVPGKSVNYSDSFFPAEHEYQSYFFLSHPAFPNLCVKSLKMIINIGTFRQRLLYDWWSFSLFVRVTRWIAR